MYNWKDTLSYMFSIQINNETLIKFSVLLDIGRYNAIDRTNVSNVIPVTTICTPLLDSENNKINMVIKKRGVEIMLTYHEPILMWSGGIDSTTAFYSLLETKMPFNVLFNANSIKEYPYLGNLILNNKIPNVKAMYVDDTFKLLTYIRNNPNARFITGEIGDQLFGSNIITNYDDKVKNTLLASCLELVDNDILELVTSSIMKALNITDVKSLTLSEYFWAINFIFKYQTVQLRVANMGLRAFGDTPNCKHFFDTKDFNSYAIANYKTNNYFISDTLYKLPLKEYIFSQNGDDEYLKNKTKHRSLRETKY